MTEEHGSERIVEAARAFAAEAGRDVDRYDVASLETEESRSYVFFQGTSGLPGDHFTVEVDGATGEGIRLIPGR